MNSFFLLLFVFEDSLPFLGALVLQSETVSLLFLVFNEIVNEPSPAFRRLGQLVSYYLQALLSESL